MLYVMGQFLWDIHMVKAAGTVKGTDVSEPGRWGMMPNTGAAFPCWTATETLAGGSWWHSHLW